MNTPRHPDLAESRNPATGELLRSHPFDGPEQIEAALTRSHQAFLGWRPRAPAERAEVLARLAGVLRERAEPLARTLSAEMGKPIVQARAEVEKCAVLCDWYATNGPALLAAEAAPVAEARAYIAYQPLGPVLAVMPWNFPLWQVLRGAVPILLAGNSFVLKPAPNVMGSSQLLAEAWTAAGLDAGLFEVINLPREAIGALIADVRIAAVTLTGSVGAGAAVAAQAGAALKKCVLELGGSDPFIVLADADLDGAVEAAVKGRFQNTGQVCIAAKRIIVEASVLPAFTEKFVAAVKALIVGDPQDESTFIGPMARADLRDQLHAQVQATLAQGAKLLLGGEPLERAGNYYAPTVLAEVTPAMTSFREELFGPVASLVAARDAEHAIELANDSEFGLGGSVWTRDIAVAERLAARIETGAMFINGYTASDPRVPIGGVKKSGFGRELSHFGLREFSNAQTVWIAG